MTEHVDHDHAEIEFVEDLGEQRRNAALEYAVEVAGLCAMTDPVAIIGAARLFEAYLSGKEGGEPVDSEEELQAA